MQHSGNGDNSIRIAVVTTAEQLSHVFAIRAICFYEELDLTGEQAFDGNDYQSTHIIIYSGNDPIGASRIRWFRDFAKIERSGFRKAYRNARNLRQVGRFMFEHIAAKGYSTIVTHAEPELAQMWCRLLGFQRTPGRPLFEAANHPACIELVKTVEVPDNAISLMSDPKLLFRVEGYWDVPGAFEMAEVKWTPEKHG